MPTQTFDQLLSARCREMGKGEALSDPEVVEQLAVLPGWVLKDQHLVRTLRFGNYYQTIAFVNALAYVVHREDHHPELSVGYNRCTVKFTTHSADGVTMNDFVCAAKCDALERAAAIEATPGA